MAGRKVFSAGEVLQAADVNDFLMDQSVMVFAGTAARGSAIPSPTEGMVTYLSDSNQVQVYNGSSFGPIGTILQVVSVLKTDTFSASVASGGISSAVTDLSLSITPSSTSSKIVVMYTLNGNAAGPNAFHVTIYKDNAPSDLRGDASGTRQRVTATSAYPFASDYTVSQSGVFVDSPNTTSATTYDIRVGHSSGSTRTVYINRAETLNVGTAYAHGASSLTLMEVAG